jgi:outer membrane protein
MGWTRNINFKKRDLGRAFMFAAILAAAFNATAMAGSVQPNAEQIAAYEKSTEGARIKLLMALAKQGQHELADSMIQRYPLTGKYAGNRTLYIEGLILRGRKDLKGAAAKFRAALADDPKLTLVRTDLAQTLVAMGEDDSAKHHLQLLEADAPNAQVASNIRALIDHVDKNSPYKFNAYISLAPSTNINNGSSHDKVKVYSIFDGSMDETEVQSRGKSGLGTAFGVSGTYTKSFGQNWSASFSEGGSARVYSDRTFNNFALNQAVDLRYSQDRANISVGMFATEAIQNDLSGMPFYSYGPRVSATLNVTAKDAIFGTAVFEKRIYRDALVLNGWGNYNEFGWRHAFDPTLNVTTSIGFDRLKSGYNEYSYKTWYTGLELYKELPHGITADVSSRVQHTTFDVFNQAGQKFRKDNRLIGSLGLVKRDWNIFGFAPSVEYTFVKNFSNLNIYDYNSSTFDVRLTKNF